MSRDWGGECAEIGKDNAPRSLLVVCDLEKWLPISYFHLREKSLSVTKTGCEIASDGGTTSRPSRNGWAEKFAGCV